MRVDVFPEFAPPIVEIQTPCLGLSPTEVEALVTIPIEQALAGSAGPRHPALQVGHGPVVGQDDLQARRRSRCWRGSTCRKGSRW